MGKATEFVVRDNGVAVLTLNRPKALNAFTADMCDEVPEICKRVSDDPQIKALVITGAGKGFSAGGDITTLAGMKDPIDSKEIYDKSSGAVTAVYEVEKPVIAAVNGTVAGAATALMMACDLVVASEEARFGFNFVNIAFCPDSGCSYFLNRKVGYHKALEILWFGKLLNALEALELGLVNRVVPKEEVLAQSLKWADKLVAGPRFTIAMDKKLLRAADSNDFYAQAELEALYQVLCWSSADFKEGTMAFIEKRKPGFIGR
ncbi:MAG TPA: enoyl-CoA hydratase-related protein [Syntrophomonadaceae bacterium]|nr:enoyl-CoA hydratase-related protein [Syntrophomonadaceae bacterium]